MARVSSEVWTTSNHRPAAAMVRAGRGGLGLALGRQGHVVPAGEQVLLVPGALAVAEQDERRAMRRITVVGAAVGAGRGASRRSESALRS